MAAPRERWRRLAGVVAVVAVVCGASWAAWCSDIGSLHFWIFPIRYEDASKIEHRQDSSFMKMVGELVNFGCRVVQPWSFRI